MFPIENITLLKVKECSMCDGIHLPWQHLEHVYRFHLREADQADHGILRDYTVTIYMMKDWSNKGNLRRHSFIGSVFLTISLLNSGLPVRQTCYTSH